MDYWMEITPRLEITVKSTTFSGFNAGDVVTLEVEIENLSPYLSTLDMLDVTDENYNPLTRNGMPVNTIAISPDYKLSKTIEFELPHSLTDDTLNVMVGNEYTGFRNLVIEPYVTQTETLSSTTESTSIQGDTSSSGTPNGTPGLILSSVLLILPLIAIPRAKKKK
ncbi:MAG: hypothetical protein ACW991_04030, partial [Candidatus Hodarchaeales archaeon]|jgi:hypothetical protein